MLFVCLLVGRVENVENVGNVEMKSGAIFNISFFLLPLLRSME